MRGVLLKTVLATAVAGSALLISAQANAHDRDWDKWDRWERRHHHHRHVRERVVERPVIVERPVVLARPTPVYMAPPMMPYGGGYQDPSVNFNFSFPMR